MKSEHDAQCEELSKAKCEVEEQLSNLESQREQLRAKEEEIKNDEERLEKLRSANAKETEELLQKQQVELRKDIDKEKKRLQSLKKYVDNDWYGSSKLLVLGWCVCVLCVSTPMCLCTDRVVHWRMNCRNYQNRKVYIWPK